MPENKWPKDWIDPETGERLTTMAKHRPGPYAKPIDYYDYDEKADLTCRNCGWHGPACDEDLFDVSCPRCETMLLIVSTLVTGDEVKAAAAAGNKNALIRQVG